MIARLLRSLAPAPPPREPTKGGIPFGDLYPDRAAQQRPRRYAPVRVAPSTTDSAVLAPANAARRGLAIVNASTAVLYLAHGPTASAAAYTVKLGPGATYILEEPGVFQGEVAGVWAAVNGSATITEST